VIGELAAAADIVGFVHSALKTNKCLGTVIQEQPAANFFAVSIDRQAPSSKRADDHHRNEFVGKNPPALPGFRGNCQGPKVFELSPRRAGPGCDARGREPQRT
jgi:hypothetical protein